MISRRTFLSGICAAGALAAIPAVRSQTIQLSRRKLSLWSEDGPAVRVGHISDMHSSAYISLSHIEKSIRMLLAEKPDIVCITGDFVNGYAPDPAGLISALRELTSICPTFACMGNHDGGKWHSVRNGPKTPDAVAEMLATANVHVMRDRTEKLRIKDRSFLLTGLNDMWSEPIDPVRAGFSNDTDPRIVLAHNPDTKDEIRNQKWNVMLSGHTHGGQIRLPYFGGRLTAPVRDDRYIEGLLPWGERYIHITRGVGSMMGLRFNCPPEVNVVDLV